MTDRSGKAVILGPHPWDAPLAVRRANLAAWKARVGKLAPVLEARLAALNDECEQAQADRAALPFRKRYPALTKWAAEILARQAKEPPLAVAAAFELAALQCEEAGQWELGARALQLAAIQFSPKDAARTRP
jgi:hypothetical protein